MKVVCKNCQKSYVLEDDKIPLQGVNVKCPKCLKVFRVAHPTTETDVEKTSWLPSLDQEGPETETEGDTDTSSDPGPETSLPEAVSDSSETSDPWADEDEGFLEEPDGEDSSLTEEPLENIEDEFAEQGESGGADEDADDEDEDDTFSLEETHVLIPQQPKGQPQADPMAVYKRQHDEAPGQERAEDRFEAEKTRQINPLGNPIENFEDYAGKTRVSSVEDGATLQPSGDPVGMDHDFPVFDAGSRQLPGREPK